MVEGSNLETELEQCSSALRASEARFRNIIDRSADGVLVVDNGGTIRFANPAAEILFGRSAEDLTGQPFGFPVVAGGTSELSLVSQRGEGAEVEMRVVETEWEGESACLASLRDITEQKRTVESLRRSEERYSALVRASSQVLYSMSPDWSEMRRLQGGRFLADTEKPNQNWLQEYIHPDDQRMVLEAIGEAVRTGTVFELEHRVQRADGTLGWTWSRAVPVRDADGKIVEWFGAASDITERKWAEEEIKRLNSELAARAEELEVSNRELEAFNYTVAHDLRNPLNIISGHCQAIAMICGERLNEECDEYLRKTYQGTLRMSQLIETLLRFSRVGKVELKREQVDISAMARKVVDELRATAPERKVKFEISEGITVDGDPDLLRIVLDNLLGNAWKFTDLQPEAIITFGVTEVDGKKTCFVRDNGPGFDMTEVADLFAPFERLPNAESHRGFGIGLATVKRIILRHGGRVWAEGEPERGASFYFTLSEV